MDKNPELNLNQNASQSQLKHEVEPDLAFVNYSLRPIGKIPGPTIKGVQTFSVVLGLFDIDGKQAVHYYEDGTEVPVVIVSYPMAITNTRRKILL